MFRNIIAAATLRSPGVTIGSVWKESKPRLPDGKKILTWVTLPVALTHPKEHLCALLHIMDALAQVNSPKSQEGLNTIISRINAGDLTRDTALVSIAQQTCCNAITRWFATYGMNAPVVNMALLNHIFWRPAAFEVKSIAPPQRAAKGIMCAEERIPGIVKDMERFRCVFTRLRVLKNSASPKQDDEIESSFERLAQGVKTTRAVVDDFAAACCQQPLEYISYHLDVADGNIAPNSTNADTFVEQQVVA